MQTRHDPYYYLPKFVRLEARVTARSTARLRDYVMAMSGGSTPKKEEEEKYYSDQKSGVPFVRVQNLNVDGHLSLDEVKYVNRETHDGLLNRSKVLQDDLLVKITGVGRMAVASVPPIGFEGNINQHIARIRTDSRATSEALAAWLNTDIAETLAKRRSTGGTRPALDYPALRSIPVILDAQVQKELSEAYAQYKQAEAEANELLAGIDAFLLSELGITLPPEPENAIANRIFASRLKHCAGSRFDPFFNMPRFVNFQRHIECLPNHKRVMDFGHFQRGVVYASQDEVADGVPVLRANNINLSTGELDLSDLVKIRSDLEFKPTQKAKRGDILICAASGSKEHAGKVCYIQEDLDAYLGGFMMALRCRNDIVMPEYVAYYMQSKLFRMSIFRHLGGTNINNVSIEMFSRLSVLIPSPQHQQDIVRQISEIRAAAKNIRFQAELRLDATQKRIESILLGEVTV